MGRGASLFIVVVAVAAGAAAVYGYSRRAPGCDSEWASRHVFALLRDEKQLTSIYLNNAQSVTGEYFATQRTCSAQFAEIKGNVTLANTAWRALSYSISGSVDHRKPVISLEIGDSQAYVRPPPSLMRRLLGSTD